MRMFCPTAAVLLLGAAFHSVDAQETRIRSAPRGSVTINGVTPSVRWFDNSPDRAVLGVTMADASRADTAGVRIEAVDANGPAAKAGLKAGDVLTAVNGASLEVAGADADLAAGGLAQRRLQRAMEKVKPGETISVSVRNGGASRTANVATVSARDLEATRASVSRDGGFFSSGARDSSGAIGVSVGTSGIARDTLGLFVNSVVAGGPAEKAGLVEGERIAAVNGIDVRVPREDVTDRDVASARARRFQDAVRKVSPGGAVTLRVYSNGRYREISVLSLIHI